MKKNVLGIIKNLFIFSIILLLYTLAAPKIIVDILGFKNYSPDKLFSLSIYTQLCFWLTWLIGLTPPILLRVIRKKPWSKPWALFFTACLWAINLTIAILLTQKTSGHAVWIIVALVSYSILKSEDQYKIENNKILEEEYCSKCGKPKLHPEKPCEYCNINNIDKLTPKKIEIKKVLNNFIINCSKCLISFKVGIVNCFKSSFYKENKTQISIVLSAVIIGLCLLFRNGLYSIRGFKETDWGFYYFKTNHFTGKTKTCLYKDKNEDKGEKASVYKEITYKRVK